MVKKYYYEAFDGTRFEEEKECTDYETRVLRLSEAKQKKKEAEKEIAELEYIKFKKSGGWAPPVCGGGQSSGRDADCWKECPSCGRRVGGWAGDNLGIKVDDHIYKCEGCGQFFTYS